MKKKVMSIVAALLLLIGNAFPSFAAEEVTINFKTNQVIYSPNSTIQISGTLLKGSAPGNGLTPTFNITNSIGELMKSGELKASEIDQNGDFSISIPVEAPYYANDIYTIQISAERTSLIKTFEITDTDPKLVFNVAPITNNEYNSGDTVEISGMVTADGKAQNGVDVTISLEKGNTKVDEITATTNAEGVFHNPFAIPTETETGEYTINVSLKGGTDKEPQKINITKTENPPGTNEDKLIVYDLKENYNSGDTVSVLGVVETEKEVKSGMEVEVSIEKDGALSGVGATAETNESGNFQIDYVIPMETETGPYKVRVTLKEKDKKVFKEIHITNLGSPTDPEQEMVLTLNPLNQSYEIGETVVFTGKVTLKNEPQNNKAVAISVDNTDKTFVSETISTDPAGYFSKDYLITEKTIPGTYYVRVNVIDGDKVVPIEGQFEITKSDPVPQTDLKVDPMIKTRYKPGEFVAISGKVMVGTEGKKGEIVHFSIENGDVLVGEVGTDTTDDKGVFQYNYLIPDDTALGEYILNVTLQTGQQKLIIITITDTDTPPPTEMKITMDYLTGTYKPGDKVVVSGAVTAGGHAKVGEPVIVSLEKAGGSILERTATTNGTGVYQTDFVIPSSIENGQYTVKATLKDGKLVSKAITITKPVEAPMEITMDPLASSYKSGETILVSGKVMAGSQPKIGVAVRTSLEKNGAIIGVTTSAITNAAGEYYTYYTIPADAATDQYRIRAALADNSKSVTKNISITKTSVDLTVNQLSSSYKSGDTILITGKVMSGSEPSRGIDVTAVLEKSGIRYGTLTTAKTNGLGEFYAYYVIPSDTATGQYTLKVALVDGSKSVTRTISITKPTVELTVNQFNSSYKSGETVVISGKVMSGNEVRRGVVVTSSIEKSGVRVGSMTNATTNEWGEFYSNCLIPADTASGQYTVKVTLLDGSKTVTRTISVTKPSVELTVNQFNSSYKSGETVVISGKVMSGNEVRRGVVVTSSIEKSGVRVGSMTNATTNEWGEFNSNYLIPADTASGQYTVKVTLLDGSKTVTRTISVTKTVTTIPVPKPTKEPIQPDVNEVTTDSSTITGKAEAGTKISATDKVGLTVTGTTSSDGKFTIRLSQKLKAGTKLYVTAINSEGRVSKATEISVVDKKYPAAPIVKEVKDSDNLVTGQAEVGTTVTIKAGNQVIATGIANAKGEFSIAIKPQKAGTLLIVSVTYASGNSSERTLIKVIDKTPPLIPSVSTLTYTKISGKVESYATVTVKIGGKVIATGKAQKNGVFSLTLKAQKAGTVLEVIATDAAGNVSEVKKVVVKDLTPPAIPTITSITSTRMTGKAEIGAKVYVKIGNKIIGSATVNRKGIYTVSYKKQKGGTALYVMAKDKAGNAGKTRKVVVKE